MRLSPTLAFVVACFAGLSAPVALAQDSPDSSKVAAARNQALLSFQSDLVSVISPSADAMRLLGAALLARPLPHPGKYNDFHSLIGRAAKADDAGPAVTWARLADCDTKGGACPNNDALTMLTTQAPDNAAVWLLKLGQDATNLKKDAARQDLASAASAKLYDDYGGAALKAVASIVSTLPPPNTTIDPGSAAGANGVQVMIVFGTVASLPQPSLRDTASFCEQNAANDASIKDDCLKLGKVLEWGSSPLARSLGLHLREVLSTDPAQQDDAKKARRSLIWQVQNFAQLLMRAQTDKAQAQHLLALARSGGTQMSMILAALRDDGIHTDPADDWQPQSAQ